MATIQEPLAARVGQPRAEPERGLFTDERWSPPSSVLIATDGSSGADGAVVVGRALAQRDGIDHEMVTVFERPFSYEPPIAAGLTGLEIELAAKQGWWMGIEQQRRRLAPAAGRWPVTFEEGRAARMIAEAGRERLNPLIVMGLGTHGLFERTIGRELALDVIRESTAPVLAVHPEQTRLPKTAVVATDFTSASIEAARLALHLVGKLGTIYLARVSAAVEGERDFASPWDTVDEQTVRFLFTELREILNAPPGVQLEPVLLSGDPARAILAFATEQDVELITCGMHRYSTLERILVGSVSTRILRSAPCSVLVAPPGRE